MLQYLIDGILPSFGLPKARTSTSDGWRWDVPKLQLYGNTAWVTIPSDVNSMSVIAIRSGSGGIPWILLDDHTEHWVFYTLKDTGTKCENIDLYLTE